jgi:hypothetical protein
VKWIVPAVSIGLGVLAWAAPTVGGQPSIGLCGLGLMTLYGLGMLLGGRREIIRVLRGERTDERFDELAQGRDGIQYSLPLAVGGLTYLGSIIVLRLRG